MPVKKDLTEKLDALVDFIKEHTSAEGSSTTLTYRDIAKIVNTAPGSSVTKRLMESLKEHENILYKLDLNPKKSKKPLQFQFVDKETKFKAINNKRYKNLTLEEVEYVKEKLGSKDHRELYHILTYINYLKSEYGNEPFYLPDASEISDLLLMLKQDIIHMNEFLENCGILVDRNSKYSLFLGNTGTNVLDNSNNEEVTIPFEPPAPIAEPQYLNELSFADKIQMLAELKAQQELIFEQLKRDIESETSEISTMKQQLEEGHALVQRLLAENQELQEKNKQLEAQDAKLKANLDHAVRFKDSLIKATQDNLDVFNWHVAQVALEDSKQSTAVKNNTTYRAKLAQEFAKVGNEFYNSILNFTRD